MDRKKLLKKVLLAPLDLITLLPLAVGATLGLGAWAVDTKAGLWWFMSVLLMVISPLIYIQRLILGGQKNTERFQAEDQVKEEQLREQALNILARELQDDGDTRTDELLDDLRVVTRSLDKEIAESSGWVRSMAMEIKDVVDKLFRGCVFYLRKSLEFYRTAASVRDKTIKKQNMDEREKLILEVQKSLRQLGDILGNVSAINLKHATNTQIGASEFAGLEQLRNELSVKLQSAKDVEAAVSSGQFHGIDLKKYVSKGKEVTQNLGG